MKIIKSFKILKKEINFNQNIGFIPTMGSLHKGHLSLINIAQKKTRKVLVSIYVNPSQFNEKKDFDKYPRNLSKDISMLKKLKVDYLFLPSNGEIYKKGINKKFKIFKKDIIMCAKYRKGHFQGVLAVVNRFLQNIKSKYIFLGEKDLQQIHLIKRYLINKFNTKIYICKTIRNKNNFPMSSRNKNLTKSSLKNSEQISNLLFNFKKKIMKNFDNVKLLEYYQNRINTLCDKIEYFEIRNPKNLSAKYSSKNFKIFIAYRQNKIRLIDNV